MLQMYRWCKGPFHATPPTLVMQQLYAQQGASQTSRMTGLSEIPAATLS